ncbi:MAG: YVTN family beta-propeller repeat-containing protein [Bacteroidetes bacterium]|nr:YVTN family beta-propeller repeat-containing protein [Bacteroidota bacterium]
MTNRNMIKINAAFIILFFIFSNLVAQENSYFSPTDFEIDTENNQLIIAGKTANEIRSYNLSDFSLKKSLITDLTPKAVKLAGDNLLITQSYSEGELLIVDKNSLTIKSGIKVGHGACDIAVTSDFKTAFVANQFSNDISVVDLELQKETNRISVLRQPMQLEISKDGKYLFVANFLTAHAADLDTVTTEISIIDLETETLIKNIPLANGSNALRGMSLSADGKYIFISHNLGRFQVPTTQLEQGWMNTSAMSMLDATTLEFVATVLLDEPENGAAGSWGISCSPEFIFVAHSGTQDFSKIDYPKFIEKLNLTKNKEVLSYDLRFLSDIRTRIKVDGNGPRVLKVSGKQLFVANYFTDNINVFDTNSTLQQNIALSKNSEMDEVRLGEMYFNDASYCFQGWQACNGCHPDEARTDGLNWDLLNDGMGNPKNCKSMLLAHKTPPAMITGIRATAEIAVRKGFTHIQFTQVEEAHAAVVDKYLQSLKAIPSPFLIEGELSEKAQKGKAIFESISCKYCHTGAFFTDQKQHEIGNQGEYDHQNTWDTPTLIETWRTGPYLHDGRSASMKDVFSKEKHGLREDLSEEEVEWLTEYVLSL